ncbi:hypothetical protein [Anaerotardibacter muris]|uniref:hypothetical protein n=1 Tax=Anaerotardibacter muris TaxID=2941505 RepID=UPI00203D736E|nr:hypothetical protein [Anaerotardibacter muris]
MRQIANILQGEKLKLYGDRRNVPDWVHVRKLAATWIVLTRGRLGETHMVESDSERSNLDTPRAILREMGRVAEV